MPVGPENFTFSETVLLPEALIPNALNMDFLAPLGKFPLILPDIVAVTVLELS